MKPEYSRTTITVPWELKKRMKRVGNRVNWSAVACDAFEEKLEEVGPVEEITSIEEALKRMQAIELTSQGLPNQAAEDGSAIGKHWALNLATPEQLKKIEELKSRIQKKDETSWEEFVREKVGRRRLAKCIATDDDSMSDFPGHRPGRGQRGSGPDGHGGGRGGRRRRGRPSHPEDIRRPLGNHDGEGRSPGMLRGMEPWEIHVWRSILTERPEHPSFFHGFAEGALEVWDELKGQL